MIRPERVRIGDANGQNQVEGRAIATTYIGQRLETRFATPIGEILVTQLGGASMPVAESFHLSWNINDCVVLPPDDMR